MITLRKHTIDDVTYRVKWFNNKEANYWIGDNFGKTTNTKEQLKWLERYSKDKKKKFFTVCYNKIPIGIVWLSNIEKIHKNADLFIIIGEDKYRGKWLWKIIMKKIIDYWFQNLKLNKINLWVYEENIPAVKLYLSLWFEIEWKMKQERFFDGKYHDFLSLALFNTNSQC